MDTLGKNLSLGIVMQLVTGDLATMEAQSGKEVENGSFKLLDILHHFSSGVKALFTELCYIGTDELRQACGGAGFLLSSGIADWWAEQGPFPTYEGVNVIMYQQSSRMLLKQAAKIAQNKAPHEFFAYLGKTRELLSTKSAAKTVAEFLEPDHLQLALATRAAQLVMKVYHQLTESKAPSKTKQNELFAIEVNKMTRVHLIYIMYEHARANIEAKNI